MKDIFFIASEGEGVPLNPDGNDIQFANGDLVLVDGPTRKFQDIAKILLTQIGADPIIPTYGSDLPSVMGHKNTPETVNKVTDSIVQAMAFLVEAEQSPLANENIKSIVTLNVQDGSDPRELDIRLVVALQSMQPITVHLGS